MDLTPDEISLVEAARYLRVGYQRAYHLVLIGALRGRRVDGTHWVVQLDDVKRLAQEQMTQ